MLNNITKKQHLNQLAEYRRTLFKNPQLRQLFFELTLQCNEHCLHCGSSCGDVDSSDMLSTKEYHNFLDYLKENFSEQELNRLLICVTGGEPLLRKDFFDIMGYANKLGFNWGMTSNATLINDEVANRLHEVGMKTISVSIDGLEDSHDAFRRTKGGYRRAMEGINALIKQGGFQHIQVTTVVHKKNIDELEDLYNILCGIDIDSWRVINLEPIGRANNYPELLLDANDYKRLFNYIYSKRQMGMPVSYGCSHYLGTDYEREVRDWYFLCNAGIYVASIMANGNISACLDIERRPELIQGNIRRDDFKEVWLNKFEPFRQEDYRNCEKCQNCSDRLFCGGDSFHTWNFDKHEPNICFKDILF